MSTEIIQKVGRLSMVILKHRFLLTSVKGSCILGGEEGLKLIDRR